jgi:hypothetical protein
MAAIKAKKTINKQRRKKLFMLSQAAALIAGLAIIPNSVMAAMSFKKSSTGPQALYLTDTGEVCINTTSRYDASTKLTVSGDIRAINGGKVWGSVWNDYADFFEVEHDLTVEPGKVYVRHGNTVSLSKKRCEKGSIGIASDTFGFSVGQKNKKNREIPIAVAGIVLAVVDKLYDTGTALTSAPHGKLTAMNLLEKMFFPERIVGTFYKPESQSTWNGVAVNGRHWVKIQ